MFNDARHGPLPAFLVALTVVSGIVDAVSFLRLGHVFVANMTGNVVFLGFAAAGAPGISAIGSILAMLCFALGAVVAGRLIVRHGAHRGRLLFAATSVQCGLVALATCVAALDPALDAVRYLVTVIMALAMGVQNATARRIGVPDLTTTVVTMSFTGLVADSPLAGGHGPSPWRRITGIVSMCLGAFVGALLVLRVSAVAALGTATLLLALTAMATWRASTTAASWTQAPAA
ncbi:MAG TPA: YoaK family protein [Candidatus Sulfotelmatobacter sp.]|nr:YoaK family protein [Candidatus Sulfotelmatobacter sp.]